MVEVGHCRDHWIVMLGLDSSRAVIVVCLDINGSQQTCLLSSAQLLSMSSSAAVKLWAQVSLPSNAVSVRRHHDTNVPKCKCDALQSARLVHSNSTVLPRLFQFSAF